MQVLNQKQLANGHTLTLAVVSSHGGGEFYKPGYLRIVESAGEFRSIRSKSVVDVHFEESFNFCAGRGPSSHFGRALAKAERQMQSLPSMLEKAELARHLAGPALAPSVGASKRL